MSAFFCFSNLSFFLISYSIKNGFIMREEMKLFFYNRAPEQHHLKFKCLIQSKISIKKYYESHNLLFFCILIIKKYMKRNATFPSESSFYDERRENEGVIFLIQRRRQTVLCNDVNPIWKEFDYKITAFQLR